MRQAASEDALAVAFYKRVVPTEPGRFCPRRGCEIIAQGKAASAATLGKRSQIWSWSSV